MDRSQDSPEPPRRLIPGDELVGRYRVERFLGAGGMAEVYQAHDALIQRPVAIKILNDDALLQSGEAGRELLSRFFDEARTAARIHHPNAVMIFDMGVSEPSGLPFIVMALIEGHDLEVELHHRGPMPPQRAVSLLTGCLEALGEAHLAGIVHKDLKPSNLMLHRPGTEQERLLVLDFGVARSLRSGRHTRSGEAFGTPQYMAPEYIARQEVSPALDVYQMGLILVEMLTGAPVVDDDNIYQCLLIHGQGALSLPSEVLRGPLGSVVTRALALDPTQRPADAHALRRALLEVLPAPQTFITRYDLRPASAPPPHAPHTTTASGGIDLHPNHEPPTSPRQTPDSGHDQDARRGPGALDHSAHPGHDDLDEGTSARPSSAERQRARHQSAEIERTPTVLGGPPRRDPAPAQPRPSMAQRPRLVLYHRRKPWRVCPLDQDETLIGRLDPVSGTVPDVDLTELDPDSLTSRRHALIYRSGDRFHLYPLSSAGTQLNQTILPMGQRAELHHGDVIILSAAFAMKVLLP